MRTYRTFIASKRIGGRKSCADGMVRVSTTISEEAFMALRSRADAAHTGISGQAAAILEQALIDKRREQAA
jgi:hypothetical protein